MILVTGASGHLGKSLVERLVGEGEKVRIFTRTREIMFKGTEAVYGDILDPEAVKQAVDGIDVIYHLAAAVDYKPIPNKLMYDTNVTGTKNLLDLSKAKRFIYTSSTSVYGNRMKENPAKENTPYNPSSYYGTTKMMAEKLVLEKGGIVIRAPVIYGPGFNYGFEFVLSQLKSGRMRIIGNGTNMIQWIHVNDLIDALVLAKEKGKTGAVYLVAGSEAKTQADLFSLLAKNLGVPTPTKRVSTLLANLMASYKALQAKMNGKSPKVTTDQINRIVSDRTFDISKAKAELGFSPKVGYEMGAKEIVDDYLSAISLK
jgi:nucleoside-diphosphate-sugar epimerase